MWRVNSSPPSAAYMRQWIGSALVHIMACRLFGTKPLSKPLPVFVNWSLGIKLQWKFNPNTKIFIHENPFKNVVCERAAIVSRGRWVNSVTYWPSNLCPNTYFSQHSSVHFIDTRNSLQTFESCMQYTKNMQVTTNIRSQCVLIK